MTEEPRDIRATRPAVTAGVDAAIQRALEKSPADRVPSCGAFAGALAAGAAVARVVSGAASDRMTHARPAIGRRVGLIGGLVALIAMVVAAVVLTRPSPSSDPSGAAASATERSLVVLPFTSVGGDTENSYFAAGIADELTSAPCRFPGCDWRDAPRLPASRSRAAGLARSAKR